MTTFRRAIWVWAGLGMLSVLMATTTNAEDQFPKFYSIEDTGLTETFAEEAKADFSLFYDHDGRLDIGVGHMSAGGPRKAVRFTLDELRGFWKRQRHKDFVVVTLGKWDPTDVERDALVTRLTDYFLEVGFRRVRVHQGLGEGVGVLSDAGTRPKTESGFRKLSGPLEYWRIRRASRSIFPDFSVYCSHDGVLDIDIGEMSERGVRRPARFTLDDLRHFWERQRHKEFVKVTLAKWNFTDAERQALVQKLKGYFFEVGFRRVQIFQGAGTYTPAILDEVNPKVEAKGAEEKGPGR